MILIDDCWVDVGNANYDYHSFLHNNKLDLTVESTLVEQVKQGFEARFA